MPQRSIGDWQVWKACFCPAFIAQNGLGRENVCVNFQAVSQFSTSKWQLWLENVHVNFQAVAEFLYAKMTILTWECVRELLSCFSVSPRQNYNFDLRICAWTFELFLSFSTSKLQLSEGLDWVWRVLGTWLSLKSVSEWNQISWSVQDFLCLH